MRKYLQILMLIVMVISFGSIVQGAQKELTMYWCCGTQDRADMWGAMVKEFEAQNPDIKVNLTYPAGGSYINKVKVALLAGTGPDVFWMGQDLYSITDATMPLQNAVARDNNLKTIPSTILGMNYWLGNLVGVPFGINITNVFYNKSLLAEAGLRIPTSWTWDDVISYGRKLTRDPDGDGINNVWGFSLNNSGLAWFYSYGSNPYNDAGTRMTINNPENIEGMRVLQSIWTKNEITPMKTVTYKARDEFMASRLAMNVDGPASMATANAVGLDYDVAPFPSLNYNGKIIKVGQATPESFAVSATTKYPEESVKLLAFILNKDNMVTYAKMGTVVPTMPSSMNAFLSSDSQHNRKAFIDEIPYLRPFVYQHPNYVKMGSDISKQRENCLTGKQTAAETLEQLEILGNKSLDDYWANVVKK